MTEYLQLDPRPASRQNMLDLLEWPTLGIEVTDPSLAKACLLGSVDPQHAGGRADLSAIEAVSTLLNGDAKMATISPDLDSLGAMAVFGIAVDAIAQLNALAGDVLRRIAHIGRADRFERGDWPGVRPFPTAEMPWTDGVAGASDTQELAAMAAVVADFQLPLAERVNLLRVWLATGEEPAEYRTKVEAQRLDMVAALTDGRIAVNTAADGRIATVVSTHHAGLAMGYHRAPVTVALNPAFRFKGGEPIRKFTIAQYREGYVEFGAMLRTLTHAENGWGGSPTIGGSPQGLSSGLELEQVVRIVEMHLL